MEVNQKVWVVSPNFATYSTKICHIKGNMVWLKGTHSQFDKDTLWSDNGSVMVLDEENVTSMEQEVSDAAVYRKKIGVLLKSVHDPNFLRRIMESLQQMI